MEGKTLILVVTNGDGGRRTAGKPALPQEVALQLRVLQHIITIQLAGILGLCFVLDNCPKFPKTLF